jgi:phosphoglycolate phosphatase
VNAQGTSRHTLGSVPDLDTPASSRFAVGFDLDLTLADTRRGIGAVYAALAAETGVFIDIAAVTARLGPPLEHELAHWFPAAQVTAMAERYRAMYGDIAVPASEVMPGAPEAVEAVRARGGRVIVVTAKSQRHAEATVEHLGLPVDEVVGGLFAAGKAVALREHGVGVYVGDHIADVDAARAAEAHSVAVATGPFDAAALRAHGADVVLDDLVAFPGWLGRHRPAA